MIGGRRSLPGRKVADRRIRVERPHSPYFRYAGAGQLVAREAASRPRNGRDLALARLRALLLWPAAIQRGGARGTPVKEEGARDLQLGCDQLVRLCDRGNPARPVARGGRRVAALARRSRSRSRSCSRSCPCPTARSAAPTPTEAGRTSSRRLNLAPIFGLIAAAALLIDYVMTVAVSTAAAIAQIQSVIPAAYEVRIEIAFVSISLITIANLRGCASPGTSLRSRPISLSVSRSRSSPLASSASSLEAPHRFRPSRMPSRLGRRRSASCCCSRRSRADPWR